MTRLGFAQIAPVLALVLAAAVPLGRYIAALFSRKPGQTLPFVRASRSRSTARPASIRRANRAGSPIRCRCSPSACSASRASTPFCARRRGCPGIRKGSTTCRQISPSKPRSASSPIPGPHCRPRPEMDPQNPPPNRSAVSRPQSPNAGLSARFGKVCGIDECVAGAGGFEPPYGGIKIRCLTAWRRPNAPGAGGGRTIVRAFMRRNPASMQLDFRCAPACAAGSGPRLRQHARPTPGSLRSAEPIGLRIIEERSWTFEACRARRL